jgi:hypothetical protein
MNYSEGYYLESAAKFATAMLPIVALVVRRQRLGLLNSASWLVAYGALVAVGENAGWTFWYTLTYLPPDAVIWTSHAQGHAFMAAVYAVIGMTLLVVMARSMLRKGSRLAWGMLLFALLVGGSVELIVHGPTGLIQPHTAPPNGVTGANLLFVYLFAWAAALIISWRPVFSHQRKPTLGPAAPSVRRAGA